MRPLYFVSLLLGIGCTNPSVTGDIKGEPVCPDFELGAARTKMKGSLKKPVKISIIEDDEVRWERVMLGKRSASDPDPKFVVEDDDETYTVRWAQCPNVFAPKRVDLQMRPEDITTSYACGEAVTYDEQQLEVREGDPSSRVLQWVAPPETACWTSTVTEDKADAPDAGAPDAGTPDAGAPDDADAKDAGTDGAGGKAASDKADEKTEKTGAKTQDETGDEAPAKAPADKAPAKVPANKAPAKAPPEKAPAPKSPEEKPATP